MTKETDDIITLTLILSIIIFGVLLAKEVVEKLL